MDWFKGKSTGNHRLSHQIWGFPVNFTLIQSIDIYIYICGISSLLHMACKLYKPSKLSGDGYDSLMIP